MAKKKAGSEQTPGRVTERLLELRALGKQPGRGSDQFVVRYPDGMREKIAQMAKLNGRSINAEIIARLEKSIAGDEVLEKLESSIAKLIEKVERLERSIRNRT